MDYFLSDDSVLVFLAGNDSSRLRTAIILHQIESAAFKGDFKALLKLFERLEESGGVESPDNMRQVYFHICLHYATQLIKADRIDLLKLLAKRISRMESYGDGEGEVKLISDELMMLKEDMWFSIWGGNAAEIFLEKSETTEGVGKVFSYVIEEMEILKSSFHEFELTYDFQHSIRISDDGPRKPGPGGKKERNPWSDLEVETLKEGVNKYRDIRWKWKNILDENKNIFVNRTTTDLKDKWRLIDGDRSKKESKQKGAL